MLKDILAKRETKQGEELPAYKYPLVIPYRADSGKQYNYFCEYVGIPQNSSPAVLGAKIIEILDKAKEAEIF